jgi:transposase InsO family protein
MPMLGWAHEHGVKLYLIETSKPNQNAYIESFNGRLWDEYLNEHWFISLPYAKGRLSSGDESKMRKGQSRHWAD